MPLDTTRIEKLIERAEGVRGMTFGRVQDAAPLSDDDKLEDLPPELIPPESVLPAVRKAIGYKIPDGHSWDRYKHYELITDPKTNFEHRGYDGQFRQLHGNYRELVAKLLLENPVKNPACYRVFYNGQSGNLAVSVSEWPIYAGDDLELARGLLYSLKRLRVTNKDLSREFHSDSMIETHGGGGNRFAYISPNKAKALDLNAKRKQKGQLPFHFVRDLFWAMKNAMNDVTREAAFSVENHYLADRTFCGYADRVYLAHPLFLFLTKRSGRKVFVARLREIESYIPGMLKTKVPGRAAFAKWVRKALKKERR